MRKTLIRQGKVSKNNALARKKIAEIAEERDIDKCEIGFDGCSEHYTLAPAHRHPREWYRADVDKLSDYNEWICCCVSCHNKLDNDNNLKEIIFRELRPR